MKKVISIMMALLLAFSTMSVVFAEPSDSEITPYYDNTIDAKASFSISSGGYATGTLRYSANSNFTRATIYSYIEKKVGSSWMRVYNGQSSNQWVESSYSASFTTSHSIQLASTGNYRFCVEFHMYGSKPTDTIITYAYANY